MDIITLDLETYYAQGFSLSNLSTEEYIRDPRFEVIGVGIKVNDAPVEWYTGTQEELRRYLLGYDWTNSALLCHNTMFDGAILRWFFNISPVMYLDTLCMARAIHGVDAGGSLAALSEHYKLGQKGTEVVAAKGKRRADFTPEDLAQYGEYCKNDVELTYKLFNILSAEFPPEEAQLIDITLRMFIQPRLYVDGDLLEQRLIELREEKKNLLGTLVDRLDCGKEEDPEEAVRKKLSSNKQFAELLRSFGVEPPTKTSPTTGKETYALAKNDEGFIALTEHEDSFIQHLCAVRLGTKSTIEESRIERFIKTGERNRGMLPIPLKYYGAHTGRWAGSDKVNFQNLPSRDKKKKTLKNAVVAPEGYVIINCDSSQIEARVLAWLAGQDDVVEAFAKKRDVYCEFATKVYAREITKADPVERFVGKTCILGLGYGTGAAKLQHTLKTQPPGAVLDIDRCKEIVDIYRTANDKIVNLWNEAENCLRHLIAWPEEHGEYYLGKTEAVRVTPIGLRLPNGLYIRYKNLRREDGKFVYDSRKGVVSLWGGAIVENIVQALARIVVGEQMLEMSDTYRPVLTVHDAAVCVAAEDEADEAMDYITKVMSRPRSWCPDLPVACEAKFANNYGGC